MQDPYSAMMASHQRNDPFKTFTPNRQPVTTAPSNIPASSASSYYHGLNYGSNLYGNVDAFNQSMAMASLSHDYSPLPAHMGSQPTMNTGNGLSRMNTNPSSHTISHTATSTESSSHANHGMPDMTSPMPSRSTSSSRVSLSPEGNSQMSTNSPGNNSVKQESTSSDNSSVKSCTEEEAMGVPPKKRHMSGPQEEKDGSYWDKRKKNNESAKRSREARRMKEEQIALRVVYLEQENLQLRTEVSLLKSEIEKLRCMLYNS